MDRAELLALGEDIKKNGLAIPITLTTETPQRLVDGRNRLDAMELVGIEIVRDGGLNYEIIHSVTLASDIDFYEYVTSANIHRRHLTAKEKRDLIAKVLKAAPEKSNREIAKTVKADDKTVAKVRHELESTAEIPQLEKTVGKDGKARKKRKKRRIEDVVAKKGAIAPIEVVREVVASDEVTAILKEFATFVLGTAKSVTTDPKDHNQWKTLRGRAKAVLGIAL